MDAIVQGREGKSFPFTPTKLSGNPRTELYQKVLKYLDVHEVYLDRELSLSKFSSIVGTNTTYLSNTVNEMFGCNLKSLINWYRVQYAKEVLRRGICRLKDIPFVCGFASKSTFYASFKRCEGITPNRFMNICRKGCEEQ